jgi:hypothetical protein
MAGKLGARIEHTYCEPFADGLAQDAAFRTWVLQKAGLGNFAKSAWCLWEKQREQRPNAKFWWKDYYCHERRCTCEGLAGRQIDVLAIFQDSTGRTIGLHVECKHPKDKFHDSEQACGYRKRASCWGPEGRNPPKVLSHGEAITVLMCDRKHRHADSDVKGFDAVLYFDEIAERIKVFPAREADQSVACSSST